MLATGATNANRDVASMVQGEQGQPAFEKLLNVLLHLPHFGHAAQIVGNRLIHAGQGAQLGIVMRVGQHADIKHIV